MVCRFCAVNITGDIKNFVQILILLNEAIIVEISGNNEKHKKADRILEMPRLGVCWIEIFNLFELLKRKTKMLNF